MKRYKEYNRLLLDKKILKPITNTSYASQGVCEIDNVVLSTMYDTTKKDKSILLVIINKEFKILYFDNYSHVGAISYYNNYIYVSNENYINIYELDYIKSLDNHSVLEKYNKIKLNNKVNIASYFTIENDNLYVGEFTKNILEVYDIKSMNLKYTYILPINNIQGICIYKDKYIFSSSYGRYNDSKLFITTIKNNKIIIEEDILFPSQLEQISKNNLDELIIIFESDCKKYKNLIKKSNKYIQYLELDN